MTMSAANHVREEDENDSTDDIQHRDKRQRCLEEDTTSLFEQVEIQNVETECVSLSTSSSTAAPVQIPNGCLQIYKKDDESYLVTTATADNTLSKIHITNTAGYVVADFCGMSAFQQVLWVPKIDDEKNVNTATTSILATILWQSILMDGVNVLFLSNETKIHHMEGDSTMSMELKNVFVSSERIPERAELMQESEEIQDKNDMSTSSPKQEGKWVQSFSRALESRWMEEQRKIAQQRERQQRQRYVLQQSRAALRCLLRPPSKNWKDPKLLCTAVRVLPSIISSTSETLRTTVILTVTVENPNDPDKHDAPMQEVHISCTAAEKAKVNVCTHSGIVPQFKGGSTASIRVIVEIDGLALPNENETPPLRLGLEAHWCLPGPTSGSNIPPRQLAACLGVLRMPLESILVSHPHQVVVADDTVAIPRIDKVFECREPHVIRLDVSRCTCDWSTWVNEIQETIMDSGHDMELRKKEGSATATLTVYAFPSFLAPALLNFVTSKLPETATIVS